MDGGVKKLRPENRRENANPVSAATFTYTLPTFFKGFKADLEERDLPKTLTQHESSRLGDKLEQTWYKEVERAGKTKRDPSLLRVLIRVFWAEYMFYGLVYAFAEFAIRLMQPICLGKLIRFFTPVESRSNVTFALSSSGQEDFFSNDSSKIVQPIPLGYLINFYSSNGDITKQEAYFYATAVVACSLLNVFFVHPYMMGCLHIGMKMRVACCSLIYRKALKLSKTAIGQTTVGQLVNLLSNDVNRFDVAMIFGHNLWVGPLETIVITYLMYLQVGISAVIGVCFLLIFIPLQIFLGKKTSVLRLRTAIRTDERVRLMNEIISGIQVIKMYTWERPFNALVALARRYEIKTIRGTSYIRGIILSFIMFTTRISIFVSVLSYVLLGNRITAEQVFVLTSFYGILRQNMTVFFPNGISQIAEAIVSINRLNNFMLYNENTETLRHEKEIIMNGEENKDTSVDSTEKGIFMKEITAKWTDNVAENTLENITLQVRPGHLVAVIGPVGSGKSSLLHAILKELPLSSGSIDVNGVVSYASQEPWLFAGSVRQNILFGLPMDRMRYKMVVKKCALERDFQLFPYGDKTIVGERGVSLSGGQRARINLARAVYKQADIYLLDDPLSAVDTHVGKQLFEECVTGYLQSKTVILITHQLQYLKEVDQIVILKNGKIEAQGDYNTLRASGLDFAKMLDEQKADIKDEPNPPNNNGGVSRHNSIHSVTSDAEEPKQVEEHKSEGSIGGYVYRQYFKNGGNCCFVFVVFALFILAQGAGSGGDYFITYWVNLEQTHYDAENGISNNTVGGFWDLNTDTCIYIYSGVTAATIIITLIRSFTFFTMCMRASINLHDRMFTSITRAPMYFFNTNPSGRILNRFSKDMGAIDELLPQVLIDCLQIGLTLVGIIIVVAVVNPYLLIPTVLVGVIFYMLRIFYLRTGRSVKRLEGTTRSPVFSHLNASLQGLTTIRAFKAQSVLEKEFDAHQDLHSSAWYLFLSTSRAFGFWLDLICVIYIAVVTLSFLVLGDDYMGGNVGLAITQSIGLTGMFQWGMRQSTELENQMTSVERVLEYSDLESERPLETTEISVPKDWPDEGRVKFSNVYLRYTPTDPHVLHNLTFTIEPEEKVGIVGRTGAGKSSLIAALFQLTDTEGLIEIDRLDTSRLGLHDLRSKISIIPQEPVLFSGTMRKNLDPFDEYPDEVLWKALEGVELKEAVNDLASGLNSKMSEGGSNFSVGQRQLVCLARAIIRNNKILVLDEATANVDPHTDALIQTTIRKKFSKCTVLTIAHRLHTIMDSDKVLVMDAGTMVEFDHPHILLQLKTGFLYGMVQQTGPAMADTLAHIAELHYRKTVLGENMIPVENQ